MGDPSSRISKQYLTTYDQRKDTPNFPIKTHQLLNPQFRNLIKKTPHRRSLYPSSIKPPQLYPVGTNGTTLHIDTGRINLTRRPPPNAPIRFSQPATKSPPCKDRLQFIQLLLLADVEMEWNTLLCFQYLLAKLSMDKYMTYDL